MKPLPTGRNPAFLLALSLGMTSLVQANAQTTIAALPTLGGPVVVVNSLSPNGLLTGYSQTANNDTHAFLFSSGVMTDLTPMNAFSQGISVNSSGQVAGDMFSEEFQIHAFQFSNGTVTDLGTLGGSFSLAAAINESGQVVGSSMTLDDFTFQAFLSHEGSMISLGTLGGSSSTAHAINASGQVVGESTIEFDIESHGFLGDGTNDLTDLGTLGGFYSAAYALNDLGVVVGESDTDSFETHAFIYTNGVMTDLGTLGGAYSSASAVNSAGQAIGVSTTSGDQSHGFIFSGGVLTDLGTLGGSYSEPLALDNLGRVVGYSALSNGSERAFLWQNGSMVDLNAVLPPNSGWVLLSADFINDFGRIVGTGLFNGVSRAFVMDLGSGNNPPVAAAGSDQNLECPTLATLDASASTDPDGDFLTYEWSANGVVLGTDVVLTVSFPVGTHTVTLKVSDPGGLSSEDTVSVVVVDTTAPSIVCPAALTLAVSGNCQAAVPDLTLQAAVGDGCTPDGSLIVTQDPPAGSVLALGQHSVTLTVVDASGNSANCSVAVSVGDNVSPTITSSPGTINLSVVANCQALVPDLSGLVTASDNCTPTDQLVVSQNPAAGTTLAIGSHTATVTVADAGGNVATVNVTLVVADDVAPDITSITASPCVLSPPNKQSVPVTVSVVATDGCDPSPVSQITSVTCNESEDAGDIQITGALTVSLVATKNSSGTTRVYTINVKCTDASGNVSTGTVTVSVPKSNGNSGGGKKP
jgi:probable HAF family extracellular repeat protein